MRLHVLALPDLREVATLLIPTRWLRCPHRVVVSPDGKTVAASLGEAVWAWNVETQRMIASFAPTWETLLPEFYFTPDGNRLLVHVSGRPNSDMLDVFPQHFERRPLDVVWDARTGAKLRQTTVHFSEAPFWWAARPIALAPDSKTYVDDTGWLYRVDGAAPPARLVGLPWSRCGGHGHVQWSKRNIIALGCGQLFDGETRPRSSD